VLDRNGDGIIGSGRELFGSASPQPQTSNRNGFEALKMFDADHNDIIDGRDPVFAEMRMWIDRNHDGVSQPDELVTMRESGVESISLGYRTTPIRDRWGNIYRYVSRVRIRSGNKVVERMAYDVFLAASR
jgi:hypothetical protein